MKLAMDLKKNYIPESEQVTDSARVMAAGGVKLNLTALDPEVVANKRRRSYSAKYKLQILELVKDCTLPGEVGALLRREGIYRSHIIRWRLQLKKGALMNLQPKKRGVKAKVVNPEVHKIAALEKEKAKLQKDLKKAHALIELQKKISDIMGLSMTISKGDEVN